MARVLFILVLAIAVITKSAAQVHKDSEVYKVVMANDSLLFNIGFNNCDISRFEKLLSPTFEFYHDVDGLSNKQQFIAAMKRGLCGDTDTYNSRRELVEGNTQVFPLYANKVLYGILQTGHHRFYETINKGKENYAGSARFSQLWLLGKDGWQLARCYSFDHKGNDAANYKDPALGNDEAIESWLKEIKIPVLGIGVIKGGVLQQVKVYGELQKGMAAPYNTVFNVASLTKPVTAMVALRLASMGKWDINKPLYKYWTDPDIAKHKYLKLLTTKHVLPHSTGFANWRYQNEDNKLKFSFMPGTQFGYSGEGFEYLRKALEKKFGKPLSELAEELIFRPAKMNDTQYLWTDKTDASRYAPGYDSKGKMYPTVKHKTANAADDLLTTIEDYSKFMISVMNGTGLSQDIFTQMTSPQIQVKPGKQFGLGLVVYELGNGEYALSHTGADDGCQTMACILPKTKDGIVIFTNVDDGYKVYNRLFTHYLGHKGQAIIDIETK